MFRHRDRGRPGSGRDVPLANRCVSLATDIAGVRRWGSRVPHRFKREGMCEDDLTFSGDVPANCGVNAPFWRIALTNSENDAANCEDVPTICGVNAPLWRIRAPKSGVRLPDCEDDATFSGTFPKAPLAQPSLQERLGQCERRIRLPSEHAGNLFHPRLPFHAP